MSNLKKRIFFYLLIVFAFSFVINSSKNIVRFLKAEKELEKKQQYLDQLIQENKEVSKQLITLDKKNIEKLIRNNLNMAKEGETIIVLPDSDQLVKIKGVNDFSDKEELDKKNWEKWLDLVL